MRLSLRKSQLDAVRDMLADVRWKALLLVFLTALGSEVFGCKPFDSVRRRRLMRLKGNFIKIQNQCKKQIFTSIKLVARDDIKKTGPYHATGSSESMYKAIGATFACLRNTDLTKLSLQSIDDLTSFGMEYAFAIG
uniref:Putative secreted protein midgut overexpressed n=1 Tax=Rhipicephalus microplus TaxID=6941 RepID=A0A6M2D9T9_RHIMP